LRYVVAKSTVYFSFYVYFIALQRSFQEQIFDAVSSLTRFIAILGLTLKTNELGSAVGDRMFLGMQDFDFAQVLSICALIPP